MPIDLLTPEPPTPDQVAASRQAAGLSQAQAAALVGLSTKQAWSRYETAADWGRRMDPTLWALWLLAVGQHPTYAAIPNRAAHRARAGHDG